MKNNNLDHPELINGPNPLLEAMAPYISFEDMPAALARQPLESLNWRAIPPAQRITFLEQYKWHYWPSSLVLDLAESIQTMLRSGLAARNPFSVPEQRRINTLALTGEAHNMPLQSLRTPAGGGIISAITGMGKSAVLARTLEVIAPQQVVVHSRSEACGWSTLTQVLYLVIDAPFNGTPGGLLARIVEGLDVLLGTDYANDRRKLRNLDQQLLFVTKLLSNHRVGLLAIDENQQANFDESFWQKSFVLFFLGLMNLGIPILLLGNPLAFVGLESASQDIRRFSTAGYHKLTPAPSFSETWWSREFVPGMCLFSLCDEVPAKEGIVEQTFDMSAGVPGLFGPLWIEAQRIALRRGGEVAQLEHADFIAALDTPRVRELHAMALQVRGKAPAHRFTDMPFKSRGAPGSAQSIPADECDGASTPQARVSSDHVGAVRKAMERKVKAKERAAEKRREKAEHLTPEDMRRHELQMEMFASLRGTQEPLLAGSDRAPPKRR
ncbi:hypothetical protein [Frateuria sp. STR12]|uniref:hypothetical protein n=1 Tax=Frateuria hangzhouensis TaxID=2995589 RepID=UPI002260C544|nr:hypothetical protein [Frateuria sp. STR12]MCX7514990.1 hypothetical protein [Frateuria sp. STR12]